MSSTPTSMLRMACKHPIKAAAAVGGASLIALSATACEAELPVCATKSTGATSSWTVDPNATAAPVPKIAAPPETVSARTIRDISSAFPDIYAIISRSPVLGPACDAAVKRDDFSDLKNKIAANPAATSGEYVQAATLYHECLGPDLTILDEMDKTALPGGKLDANIKSVEGSLQRALRAVDNYDGKEVNNALWGDGYDSSVAENQRPSLDSRMWALNNVATNCPAD